MDPEQLLPLDAQLASMMQPTSVVGGVYQPTEDEVKLISDTKEKRQNWRMDRQVHEQEWFINAAMFRGQHYVEWNDTYNRLTVPKAPPHRVRLKINRMQAKLRARLSKYLKNRPKPVVVPATGEYQDYLNAKASQKVLDYLWRKLRLEHKFKEAVLWAMVGGKGFWWFHWNPDAVARLAIPDGNGGFSYKDEKLGDAAVEVGSPFEVLVSDPAIQQIGEQPEIMRLTMRDVETMKVRYPDFESVITASNEEESLFTYERQIAGLNPYTFSSGKRRENKTQVLVTEHMIKPNGKYPAGHYRVMVGDILVKQQDSLPYDFQDLSNPYPCVEFVDIAAPGQFWCPTVASQLIDIQREYNLMRSKLAENLRLMAHPKLLVAKQHNVPKSAWTSEAGEIVEFIGVPNIPPPQPWTPPNVAADLWRNIELLQKEFDDITQIFPAAEGRAGGATSGFQTNLLQEATEGVHAPDIRQAELSVEEAAWKIRRLVKLGYDAPRLISAIGANYTAEVFEFVNDQIDEQADVVVEAGSALPTLKAAKQETVMNMYKSGILGDPNDPEVRRRALSQLEMGAIEENFDIAKTAENQARLENKELGQGQPPANPHFWENHQVHYNIHTNLLMSPEVRNWSPLQVRALIAHTILHARFVNPQSALQIAMEEGIQEVIPAIQAMLPPPMPPGMPPPGPQGPPGRPPGPPPGPQGPPPSGPPQQG